MAEAKRDNNGVTSQLAVSNTDGRTPLKLQADPVTHRVKVNNGTTGSDVSANTDARRDGNYVPTMEAARSSDGLAPVPLYIDSATGFLLIKST